jgi:hypothetical protein
VFCLVALALGTDVTRTLKGIVSDQNGDPIQGAIVQLENTRTMAIRSFISQKDGSYQFQRLDRGVDYKVSASLHDASNGTKTLSTFDERSIAFLNLRIEVK